MLEPITSDDLSALPGIRHGFFTRTGGVSTGIYAGLNCGLGSSDAADNVIENRRRVSEYLGGRFGNVVTLYQEHGATARFIDAPAPRDALPKADAVLTATPGLVIGVLTADCAPVLFADPEARIVAAAHAGWRGAVGGILESTLAEMERHGGKRERILAALGPCINQKAYEVGDDFVTAALSADPRTQAYFNRQGGPRAHFDLRSYVLSRLKAAGVARVSDNGLCTYENESLLYSFRRTTHRKEPDYGRQISAIVVA